MQRTNTTLLHAVGLVFLASCNGSSNSTEGSASGASPILVQFPTRVLTGTAGLVESTLADLNGDGLLDLIELNVGDAELRIALGDGGVDFLPAEVLTPAGSPLTIATGDFDGDGVDEVAVASVLGQPFASFTLGGMDGDLSSFAGAAARLEVYDQAAPGEPFTQALETTLPSVPLQLSSGDFGGTGETLIVPLPGNREVWLLEPNLGELVPVAVVPSTGEVGDATPLTAIAIEINGDDRRDLLVGEADFDGDGPSAVACFLQNDDGGFDPAEHRVQAPQLPLMVGVTDLDGDGNDDAVGLDLASGADSVVCYGAASGALTVLSVHVVGAESTGATVGDFDGDGTNELAVARFESGELVIVPLDGSAPAGDPLDLGPVPRGMRVVDLDSDGFADLAAHHSNGTTFYSGGPNGPRGIRGNDVPLASQFLRVADLDGDGFDDVVTLDLFQRELAFLAGRADGGLDFVSSLPLEPTVVETPGAFELGDFDGDGDLDVVAALFGADELRLFENQGALPLVPTPLAVETDAGPRGVDVADFDSDGNLDVVVANAGSSTIEVFFGDGALGLTVGGSVAVPAEPLAIEAADLDDDGDPDVAVSLGGASPAVVLLEGDGEGGLTLTGSVTVPFASSEIVAANMDIDSNLELVVNQPGLASRVIGILDAPSGGTTFVQIELYQVLQDDQPDFDPGAFLVEDVDGDQQQDVIVVAASGRPVLLQNGGALDFAVAALPGDGSAAPAAPAGTRYMRSGDVNGDGNPELLLLAPQSPRLWVAQGVAPSDPSEL